MATVLHGSSVSRPSVHCVFTAADILHHLCREAPEMRETKVARAYEREKSKKAGVQNDRKNEGYIVCCWNVGNTG